MRRRRLWVVLGVGGLVAVAAAIVIRSPQFRTWRDPPVLVLPGDDEVAEMRASLRPVLGFPPVPEFAIPAARVPAVMSWLRPAAYNRQPVRLGEMFEELGEVVIRTTAGRELRLRFYWFGKNPAVFTAGGEDQFLGRVYDDRGAPADGGMLLRLAILAAHKVSER